MIVATGLRRSRWELNSTVLGGFRWKSSGTNGQGSERSCR